jgi:hypothetical protein
VIRENEQEVAMANHTDKPTKTKTSNAAARAELEERLNIHDAFYGMLLDNVRDDRYPSSKMMDILEYTMLGYEREEFARILLEKVSADRYPSVPMIERIARLAGQSADPAGDPPL